MIKRIEEADIRGEIIVPGVIAVWTLRRIESEKDRMED